MNPKYIIIHNTATTRESHPDQLKLVDDYHKSRGFPKSNLGYYVGYHRLITGGKNIKCREDDEVGAHANEIVNGLSLNFQSLGICVGFNGDLERLTSEEKIMLKTQIQEWQRKFNIPKSNIKFHGDYAPKTCPGLLIDRSLINEVALFEVDDQKKKVLDLIRGKVSQEIYNLIEAFLC